MNRLVVYLILVPAIIFGNVTSPFNYDLKIQEIPGSESRTLICMHGLGMNYKFGEELKEKLATDSTIVSFNFPDYDLKSRKLGRKEVKIGTIDELLPALYVLKNKVVDQGLESVDLYGFSAGGGALINTLAVLNGSKHDLELKKIGIGSVEKRKILDAIERGVVILDTPLKSFEEVIALRGWSFKLQFLASRYKKNGMRPIDSLSLLNGLKLNILVYFETPDEMLNNRDDALFSEKLMQVNSDGQTTIVYGRDGGHFGFHKDLWAEHAKLMAL